MDRLHEIRRDIVRATKIPHLPALDDALNLIDAELRARAAHPPLRCEEPCCTGLPTTYNPTQWLMRASAGEVT